MVIIAAYPLNQVSFVLNRIIYNVDHPFHSIRSYSIAAAQHHMKRLCIKSLRLNKIIVNK